LNQSRTILGLCLGLNGGGKLSATGAPQIPHLRMRLVGARSQRLLGNSGMWGMGDDMCLWCSEHIITSQASR